MTNRMLHRMRFKKRISAVRVSGTSISIQEQIMSHLSLRGSSSSNASEQISQLST